MGEIVSKIKGLVDENKQKKFKRIPQSLLNDAMLRVSLVDIISQTVTLSQASKDQWKGLCPFHNEKTSSFFVNETKGFFHCFGCGESGNAISFLMKAQGMGFRQAAMRVLQLAGLEYYDASDWIQGEAAIIRTSVEKTIQDKISGNDIDTYLEDINKTLIHIAYVAYGVVQNRPELFDKMEKLYLMVDDNYRFKNYERIDDICKNLSQIIKEICNDTGDKNK